MQIGLHIGTPGIRRASGRSEGDSSLHASRLVVEVRHLERDVNNCANTAIFIIYIFLHCPFLLRHLKPLPKPRPKWKRVLKVNLINYRSFYADGSTYLMNGRFVD